MAWYNADWSKRQKITIDNTKISGSSHTDFAVLLTEDNLDDTDIFTSCKSDGSDIVITSSDGTTKLKREIQEITVGTPTLQLWVKIPTLSGSADTTIFIYYGNSAASETNDTDTWNSNFKAVCHFEEDPSGSAPQMQDSTSNNNDGTSQGSMTSGDSIPVKIQNGLDFDGINDGISYSSGIIATGDDLTFSGWFVANENCFVVTRGANADWSFYLRIRPENNFVASIVYTSGGSAQFTANDGSTTPVAGTLYHIAVTSSQNGSLKLYVNGVQEGSTVNVTKSNLRSSATGFRCAIWPGASDVFYDCEIDEIHILDTILSEDWIATEYANQGDPSTFYSVVTDDEWYDTAWIHRQKITIDNTKVEGASHTDFPILLTEDNFDTHLWDNCESDGADIVITSSNGTTKLKREVKSINTSTPVLELWVKVPTLSGSADTTLYIYYGNSGASETNDTDTWDANYQIVSHYETNVTDSGQGGNNGTDYGTDDVAGKFSRGRDCVKANTDWIGYGDVFYSDTLTIEMWVNPDDIVTLEQLSHKRNNAGTVTWGGAGYDEWSIYKNTSGKIVFAGWDASPGYQAVTTSSNSLTAGVWNSVVCVCAGNGNTPYVIVNGVKTTGASQTAVLKNTGSGIQVGSRSSNLDARYLDGLVDEFRVSDIDRGEDWINTVYNNESDPSTFYSVELEYSGYYSPVWLRREKITIDYTKAGGSDLTNFPMYISEDNLPARFFSNCKADGSDIVITTSDGTTKCKIDLEGINTGSSLISLWAKIPSISGSVDTDIYIYYDNSGASETVNDADTWSDYAWVSHDGGLTDSTGNSTVTTVESIATANDFIWDNSQYFDFSRTNTWPDNAFFNNTTNDFTLQVWAQRDTNGTTFQRMFWHGGSAAGSDIGYNVRAHDTNVVFDMADASNKFSPVTAWTIGASKYNLVHCRRDATGSDIANVVVNGVSGSNTDCSALGSISRAVSACVGSINDTSSFWSGRMDEIRIRKSYLSDGWCLAEYNNQENPSTFYSVTNDDDKIWTDTDADNDANNDNNWGFLEGVAYGIGVPSATNDALFSDTSSGNACTLSANFVCKNLYTASADSGLTDNYTNIVSLATYNLTNSGETKICSGSTLTIGTSAGTGLITAGLELASGSELNLQTDSIISNSSDLTIANEAILTTSNTGDYTQTASANITNAHTSNNWYNFTNNVGVTLTCVGAVIISGAYGNNFTNNGTISFSSNFAFGSNAGTVTLGASSDFIGNGNLTPKVRSTATYVNNKSGAFGYTGLTSFGKLPSINQLLITGDFSNSSKYTILVNSAPDLDYTFATGTLKITDFEITNNNTGTATFDCSTNNPDFEISGDVGLNDGVGSYTTVWTKGTGTITLTGSSGTQTIDFSSNAIEDLVINASGAIKQLTGGLSPLDFTLTAGTVDLNGQALSPTGDVSLTGTIKSDTTGSVNFVTASKNITYNAGFDFAGSGVITQAIISSASVTNNKSGTHTLTGTIAHELTTNRIIITGDFSNGNVRYLGTGTGSSGIPMSGTIKCINFDIYQDNNLNVTIDDNTNDPNYEISGTVNLHTGGGSYTTVWTRGSGTITLTGTTGTQVINLNDQGVEAIVVNCSGATKELGSNWYPFTFTLTAGTVDTKAVRIQTNSSMNINGTLTNTGGGANRILCQAGTFTLGASFDHAGSVGNVFDISAGVTVVNNSGTLSCTGTLNQYITGSVAGLVLDAPSADQIIYNEGGGTITFQAGTVKTKSFSVLNNGGGAFTIDNSVNNPSFEVSEDYDLKTGTTSIDTYTKGTGTITLTNSSGSQNFDADGHNIEGLVINGSGATKVIIGAFTTTSLTGTAGTLNTNGKTVTVEGNLSTTNLIYANDTGKIVLTGAGNTVDLNSVDTDIGSIDVDGIYTFQNGAATFYNLDVDGQATFSTADDNTSVTTISGSGTLVSALGDTKYIYDATASTFSGTLTNVTIVGFTSLEELGNSEIIVSSSLISAKTPVTQLNDRDLWTFGVLVNRVWVTLQYPTEAAADVAYAAIV